MKKLKKGDIVGRISYNKDVIFRIIRIIKTSNNKDIYILKGLTERIEADSPADDLEIIDKRIVDEKVKKVEDKLWKRIEKCVQKDNNNLQIKACLFKFSEGEKRSLKNIYIGKILHLDGDKRYADKSMKYYKSLGLDAIVKNIPENKQSIVVKNYLDRYNPDILVLTRT